jgi:hypothetical protein
VTRQTKRQTGTSFRCRQPRTQLQITLDRRRILQASPPQLSVSAAANLAHRSSRKSRKSRKKSRETQVTSLHVLGFSECIGLMPMDTASSRTAHGQLRICFQLFQLAPHRQLQCDRICTPLRCHFNVHISTWKLHSTGNCNAQAIAL